MKKFVSACALLLSVAATAENAIEFETAGLKIGDKITQKFSYDKCPAKEKGNPEILCSKFVKIGESRIFVMYFFHESKFAGITLSFDSPAYDDVVAAYVEKFKTKPHKVSQSKITTTMGAQLVNETSTWNTTEGLFTIQKYGDNVREGFGVLQTSALTQWQKNKDAIQAKKAAKDI